MSDPTSNPNPAAEVVRARRFELLDDYGRVRAVLGDLAGAAQGYYLPGLAVRSGEGSERISLLLDETGPVLNFSMVGNDALVLGVFDPDSAAVDVGPYVVLLNRAGEAAVGWRVHQDGSVTVEPAPIDG